MLADENAQQNTEATDLKMLGWTVPREFRIQNYVDSDNIFHQRVGRVELSELDWTKSSNDDSLFYSRLDDFKKSLDYTNMVYCKKYYTSSSQNTAVNKNITGFVDSDNVYSTQNWIYIKDETYTSDASGLKESLKGIYAYYELATEITTNVDGNEAVTKVNDSLSVIGKCKNLLNPTLATTTTNGVTCTANGDGTYTVNGTASIDTFFALESYKSYTGDEIFRLVGCPSGGASSKYSLAFRPIGAEQNRWDSGDGVTFNDLSVSQKYAVVIIIRSGVTVSNLVFKPMLVDASKTPNATYDDFVPYTGDGETLTADVAELNSNLDTLKHSDFAGGKNLIDFSKIIPGYQLDLGNLLPYENWYVSDYIKVKPNTTYTLSGTSSNYSEECNIDKVVVKPNSKNTFTTSSNTYYLRVDSLIDGYSTPQLEEGSTATDYEPYIPSIKMLADEVSAQNSMLGGLSFSVSGTNLVVTDGKNTWTIAANS